MHLLRTALRLPGAGYVAGLLVVAGVSALIGVVEQWFQIPNVSALYLLAVLVAAIVFGRGPAVVASIVAFVTFNWFFVEPRHSLTVADPAEWMALLLFLITSVTAGHLAASQRLRTEEAHQREREAVVLYDVVRMLAAQDFEPALHLVAERLREELHLAAVAIELVGTGGGGPIRAATGEPGALSLTEQSATRAARALGSEGRASHPGGAEVGRWVRTIPPHRHRDRTLPDSGRLHLVPIEREGRRRGTLLFVRDDDLDRLRPADNRLLLAAVVQIGLAGEREALRGQVLEAEILRRTDELKTALLHAVSHDLRTPLATIIASAGSLRQEGVGWTDEDKREFAEAIEQEALRLNRIVGNLLDLSRIQAGSLTPVREWHDLGALIDNVVGRLRTLLAQHVLTVESSEVAPLLVDSVAFDQILSNLIENAVKYTPPGTEVAVNVRDFPDRVEVEVADRGPGVPAAVLPRLFDPFFRVSGAGVRPPGSGLGLAVAKGLVEAHGGKIWAQNRPGGGTRFVVSLPRTEGPATAQASVPGAA